MAVVWAHARLSRGTSDTKENQEAKDGINEYQNKHISSLVTVVLPPPALLPLVSGFLLPVLLDPSSTFL